MRNTLLVAFVTASLAAAATAQPWYARGEFNGWGLGDPLTQVDPVLWRGTVSGIDPFTLYEYKIANDDFSIAEPGSNGRIQPDANGDVTFLFYDQETWTDGWKPSDKRRVGYMDPHQYGWEIMGAFNGWSAPVLTLTDQGNGLWTGDLTVADPGRYEWKFRWTDPAGLDPWAISIGDDFGNSAGNNVMFTTNPNQVVTLELDLPGGRWRILGAGGGGPPLPYYARGEFNNWSLTDPLSQIDPVLWSGTVSGIDPFLLYEYQLANEGWDKTAPGSAGKIQPDPNGDITFHFYDNDVWTDGWMPDSKLRAGFDDPGQFAWEIMGSFNGWSDPVLSLTDQGGGLWAGDLVIADPDTYEWKFRWTDPTGQNLWAISIGDDFGNAAANNTLITTVSDQSVRFELDLPGGRWRAITDSCAGFVCGDASCDGVFNGGDIDPFFQALGDPAAWQAAHPGCDLLCLTDINHDGATNGGDIDPFFVALGLGGCP